MKKLYQRPKFKIFNKRRANRSITRRNKYKSYRTKRNILVINVPKKLRVYKKKYDEPFRSYKKVHAPENLSFIDNTIEVIKFINTLKNLYDNNIKVFVVLKNVKIITYDTIVVLLSIMVKFKAKGIKFNGDFPTDYSAKNIIKESGFLRYLYHQFKEEDRYKLGQNSSIHTHAWKNVDSVLGQEIVRNASKTVWGEERRCQGVQRTLIELMLNTNNHADESMRKGVKHWWLSVHHDKENQKVSFAFIDFGVGVFESLKNKPVGNKFYNALNKLFRIFRYSNNAELFELIMNGDMHETATGKPYHGKGLPGINMVRERGNISNLNIITNNVHAKLDNNEFKVIPTTFSGTFVFWELCQLNTNSHATKNIN